MELDTIDYHVHGYLVHAALRDDDIGVALCRLYKCLMHRLDGGEVLIDDAVERAPALYDVTAYAAQDTDIRICIDEELYVHEVAQTFLMECEDPFEYDDA